eukprot:361846-Chlamydomonas_euryale.AAC.1
MQQQRQRGRPHGRAHPGRWRLGSLQQTMAHGERRQGRLQRAERAAGELQRGKARDMQRPLLLLRWLRACRGDRRRPCLLSRIGRRSGGRAGRGPARIPARRRRRRW